MESLLYIEIGHCDINIKKVATPLIYASQYENTWNIWNFRKLGLCEAYWKVFLLNFKVYYWRDSSQLRWHRVNRGMRSKVFPNNDPEPSGVVTDLIPYSNYKMYIVVANRRYEGPPSNHIHFSTLEGGIKKNNNNNKINHLQVICCYFLQTFHQSVAYNPGLVFTVPSAPKSFRIQQRHLDSIYVDWDLPEEPNGVITGYSLKYQTGMPKDSNKRCQAHLEIRKNQLLSNSRKAGYGSLPLITIAVSAHRNPNTTDVCSSISYTFVTTQWESEILKRLMFQYQHQVLSRFCEASYLSTVNASRGEELKVEEFSPNVTSFSIRRYDRYTRYRFSVAAHTRIGLGEWHTEESPHYTTESNLLLL